MPDDGRMFAYAFHRLTAVGGNMKKIVSLLFLIVYACAPAGTAVPTLTPSPTIAPTATPDPLSPIISALQAKGITVVRLTGNTYRGWELILNVQGAPGVAILDAVLDENGFVIRGLDGDGNEIDLINIPLADLDKRAIKRGNLLIINDESGFPQAVFDAENPEAGWNFVDPEAGLAGLDPEIKLALAPDTITVTLPPTEEGGEAQDVELTKSNVSSVFPNLILYRDADGNAQKVFDIETGDVMDLREAGIIELDLTTGEKLEVRFFDDAEEAFKYIAEDNVHMVGRKFDYHLRYPEFLKYYQAMGEIRKLIVGTSRFSGVSPSYPNNHNQFFGVNIMELDGEGVLLGFIHAEGSPDFVFMDIPDVDDTTGNTKHLLNKNGYLLAEANN
jgi:hypothetical protein